MLTEALAVELMEQPCRQWPAKGTGHVGAVPWVQAMMVCMVSESLKAMMTHTNSRATFRLHYAPVVLNSVSDK